MRRRRTTIAALVLGLCAGTQAATPTPITIETGDAGARAHAEETLENGCRKGGFDSARTHTEAAGGGRTRVHATCTLGPVRVENATSGRLHETYAALAARCRGLGYTSVETETVDAADESASVWGSCQAASATAQEVEPIERARAQDGRKAGKRRLRAGREGPGAGDALREGRRRRRSHALDLQDEGQHTPVARAIHHTMTGAQTEAGEEGRERTMSTTGERAITIRRARRLDRKIAAVESANIRALKEGLKITIWVEAPDTEAQEAMRAKRKALIDQTIGLARIRFALRERVGAATRAALGAGEAGVADIACERRVMEVVGRGTREERRSPRRAQRTRAPTRSGAGECERGDVQAQRRDAHPHRVEHRWRARGAEGATPGGRRQDRGDRGAARRHRHPHHGPPEGPGRSRRSRARASASEHARESIGRGRETTRTRRNGSHQATPTDAIQRSPCQGPTKADSANTRGRKPMHSGEAPRPDDRCDMRHATCSMHRRPADARAKTTGPARPNQRDEEHAAWEHWMSGNPHERAETRTNGGARTCTWCCAGDARARMRWSRRCSHAEPAPKCG